MMNQALLRECPNPDGNPKCKGVRGYDNVQALELAERSGSLCRSCACITNWKLRPHVRKDLQVTACPNPSGNPKCRGQAKEGRLCRSCSQYGKEVSEEARQKMSRARRGQPRTEEVKRKLREAWERPGERERRSSLMEGENNPFYGRKHSEESKVRIGAASVGREFSEEARGKMSAIHKGKPRSEEAVKRQRETQSSLEWREKASARFKGERNPFYGRTHTEETKRKISLDHKGKKLGSRKTVRVVSADQLIRICLNPNRNPKCLVRMAYKSIRAKLTADREEVICRSCTAFGRVPSQLARERMRDSRLGKPSGRLGIKDSEETRLKKSLASRGERNPMFGKPVPIGASFGIGGWLNGVHFRSSSELRFLLVHKEVVWSTAEGDKFRIKYIDERGQVRHYRADFFGEGVLVEIKPVGWERIPWYRDVPVKVLAAEAFCSEHGWRYSFEVVPQMNKEEVFLLRDNGDIQLDSKWERQFQQWRIVKLG